MAAFRAAPLRQLNGFNGVNPHMRLMATGLRSFSTARPAAVQVSKLAQAAPVPSASQSYIKGTVNDPTTFPPPSAAHGSYHWAFERGLSAALVPLVAIGAVRHGTSGAIDASLALALVVHSHIGFDCIFADYLHERKFPILGPVAKWGLRAATVGTLVGLYEFQTNDVGLTELVARVWTA